MADTYPEGSKYQHDNGALGHKILDGIEVPRMYRLWHFDAQGNAPYSGFRY